MPDSKFRYLVLPCMLFFGEKVLLQLFMMFMPIYFKGLQFSGAEIGVIFAVVPVTAFLLAIPFGILSDKMVPKRMITIALCMLACFIIGLAFARDFISFFLLFVLGGIAINLFVVSITSLFYKTMGSSNRGKKMSLFRASEDSGYGIGVLLGGIAIAAIGFMQIFQAAFLLAIPLIILSFFLIKTPPLKINFLEYRADLGRKEMVLLCAMIGLLALHFGAEEVSHSLFLKETIGLSTWEIGLVFGATAIFLVSSSIPTGYNIDRWGKYKFFLLVGLLFSGLANVFYFLSFDFSTVLVNRFLHETGDAAIFVTAQTAMCRIFPHRTIGGMYGLYFFSMMLGKSIGSLFSGFIIDALGYAAPFMFTGIFTLAAFAIILFSREKFDFRESAPAAATQ